MLRRVIANGMFGSVELAADTNKATLTIGGGDAAGQLLDYTLRETGMQKLIVHTSRFNSAVTAPATYLGLKQANLIAIGGKLNDLFKAEYERLLDMGETEEQARKLSIKHLMSEKARMLEQHEVDFPTAITDAIVKKRLRAGVD